MSKTRVNGQNWQTKLTEELIDYAVIATYFFVCFSAIMIYKAVLLRESGIEFIPLSAAVVKALILGKFVLIARSLPIAMQSESLTVLAHVAVNTVLLYVVLLTFSLLEEFIVGWIHGETYAAIITEFKGLKLAEKLASSLLLLLTLLPIVGLTEMSRAMGPGALKKMLLSRWSANSDR